jgi:hypothetical protein
VKIINRENVISSFRCCNQLQSGFSNNQLEKSGNEGRMAKKQT